MPHQLTLRPRAFGTSRTRIEQTERILDIIALLALNLIVIQNKRFQPHTLESQLISVESLTTVSPAPLFPSGLTLGAELPTNSEDGSGATTVVAVTPTTNLCEQPAAAEAPEPIVVQANADRAPMACDSANRALRERERNGLASSSHLTRASGKTPPTSGPKKEHVDAKSGSWVSTLCKALEDSDISELRRCSKMAVLSKLLGRSESSIRNVANGMHPTSEKLAYEIERCLGISSSWILSPSGCIAATDGSAWTTADAERHFKRMKPTPEQALAELLIEAGVNCKSLSDFLADQIKSGVENDLRNGSTAFAAELAAVLLKNRTRGMLSTGMVSLERP